MIFKQAWKKRCCNLYTYQAQKCDWDAFHSFWWETFRLATEMKRKKKTSSDSNFVNEMSIVEMNYVSVRCQNEWFWILDTVLDTVLSKKKVVCTSPKSINNCRNRFNLNTANKVHEWFKLFVICFAKVRTLVLRKLSVLRCDAEKGENASLPGGVLSNVYMSQDQFGSTFRATL